MHWPQQPGSTNGHKSQGLQFPSHSTTEGPASTDNPWGSPGILMPSCALCCLTWPSAPTAALLSTHPLPVLPQPLPSLSSCLALAGQLPSGAQLGLGHHSNSFLSLLINLQPLEPSFCSKNVAGSLLLQDFCSSWDT